MAVQRPRTLRGTEDQDVGAAPGEQTVRHHAGHVVERGFQRHRIADHEIVHVEDHVAVVGHEAGTQHWPPAQLAHFAGDVFARHRNHFDRQRKAAQLVDELARVGDAHETPRDGRDDLLARERAAAAFDHRQATVHFVGAVDVDRDVVDVVEIEHRKAQLAQPGRGRLGTRHGAADARAHVGQGRDEVIGGGAGADAEDAAVRYLFERRTGDGALLFVLVHAPMVAVRAGGVNG